MESVAEEVRPDDRIVWVRARPGRKLVQIIEPMPVGFSVTTQWWQGETLERQDVEVAIRDSSSKGVAREMGLPPPRSRMP